MKNETENYYCLREERSTTVIIRRQPIKNYETKLLNAKATEETYGSSLMSELCL